MGEVFFGIPVPLARALIEGRGLGAAVETGPTWETPARSRIGTTASGCRRSRDGSTFGQLIGPLAVNE